MGDLIRLVPHMLLLTPLGVAEAHFLEISGDVETNAFWLCFQVETKEQWEWPAPLVRLCGSISGMRTNSHSPIMVSDEYLETLRPHVLRHKKSPFYGRVK